MVCQSAIQAIAIIGCKVYLVPGTIVVAVW